MEKYVSHKVVMAEPMNEYEAEKKGLLREPVKDRDYREGYRVVYEDGYESWSPKHAFEKGYTKVSDNHDFGWASKQLKQGERVARKGWNGKGIFVFLVPGSTFKVNRPPLLGIYQEGTEINYHAHIDMKTADGQIVPWLASQTDVLSEDWELVED